jgi:hypothetical protein
MFAGLARSAPTSLRDHRPGRVSLREIGSADPSQGTALREDQEWRVCHPLNIDVMGATGLDAEPLMWVAVLA